MRHRVGYNRLDRKASHRKAMLRNMVISLFTYERIETTKAKAKEVRRHAEKQITRAKNDTVHNRRIIAQDIQEKAVLNKLFTEIAPLFADRSGGYTRILKLGQRKGDAAEVVILELVERTASEEPKKAGKKAKKKESAPAVTEKAPAEDTAETDGAEE